jgi:predicted helicase
MTKKAKIYYARVDELWTKEQKYEFLETSENIYNIEWQLIKPNIKNHWLTDDLEEDFDSFIPLGSQEVKSGKNPDNQVIFKTFSNGIGTSRDTWAYNFNQQKLSQNINSTINTYNEQLFKWNNHHKPEDKLDNFLLYDDTKIKWSSRLKQCLESNMSAKFDKKNVRFSLYRPFTFQYVYFDAIFTHRRSQFPVIFPTPDTEKENLVICFNSIGNTKDFHCLAVNIISDLHLTGDSQCFPFYIYDEEGNNRTENITDYSLQQFREFYQDQSISKWEIFYYVYAILHHPEYRRKYAANLKRELPRIPTLTSFKEISQIGEKLAQIHVNYENQKEYCLKMIENPDIPVYLRVEKMKLSKDKTQIVYNEYLTLTGIPPEVWEYKLGNKSALDWIIDQYQIKTDKRSGIMNDPNRLDDEMYIIKLIKKIVTVSIETVKLVAELNQYSL